MNLDPGVQLDLLGALQRRLSMIVVITGATLLAAYWVAMALPNYYRSDATIFVEPQAINQKLVESGVASYDLSYRLAMMTAEILSRPRLSRVIDELGLYEEESTSMLREEVIALMRSRIVVLPVESELGPSRGRRDESPINTFRVAFTHKDPKMAADVAQRLANDFIKEHIEERVEMTRKSLEFVQTEYERLSEEYRSVQERIKVVKEENAGRLPDELAVNQRALDRTMAELREGFRALDQARSDKAFWDTQSLAAAALTEPRDEASPMHRLQQLELQLAEFRARGFTDRHPDVIRAEQEIREVRRQLELSADEEQPASLPSIAQQNADAQRERAALAVESATKEIDRLRAHADEIQSRIERTPVVAGRLNDLEQQERQLARSVSEYADRSLRAKVQVDVERRQLGEQFRILEPAFAAKTPSSPNRVLIILMGLLVGLALGMGGAVLAEASDSSFRVVRDAQNALSIPVLAAIPAIVLESDRVRERRRFVRNGLAASAVVFFCLAGGLATYFYVNGLPAWLSTDVEGEEGEEVEETTLRAAPLVPGPYASADAPRVAPLRGGRT